MLHLVTRHLDIGGAARNLRFTVDWERRQGAEVHVALGAGSDLDGFPPGVRVTSVPALVREPHPLRDLRAARQVAGLLRERPVDVLNTHQSKAGAVGRLAGRGRVPVLVHTVHMASFGPGYPRPASWAFLRAERLCGRFTDLFVTVGGELRRLYLTAGIAREDQFAVVRSPLGVERFLATRGLDEPARRAARERFALDPGPPLVVVAGLLERRKRVDLAISALAPLLRGRRCQLAVAGVGREERPLRDLVAALGVGDAVRFLGFVDDLPALLCAAQLLVHSSRAEGVPQVVVQALAAGLPVAATRSEGLDEVRRGAVAVVRPDAAGLGRACESLLVAPPRPVPAEAFRPWLESSVDADLRSLWERIGALLRARAGRRR